ncbi:MAG: Na+-translocating NADH-quinone reductase subunit C [Rhodospirillales bacterium]|jgi:Na+-transporting NADH:ubiquinone oxidoreductase subunit C|nr:Na+-translocating NADH-quinone reductase subunit C [Rhodospirillales bacterium]
MSLGANPLSWWRNFLSLPNTHPIKTIGVALLVALVCSLAVSYTAVTLKPLREANRLKESAASMFKLVETLALGFPKPRLITLADGHYADRDPGTRAVLATERDLAQIGEREDVATVYELYEDGALALVILPVRGTGYKSTLKGYLALKADLNTVAALTFHEHDETPGIGTRILEDAWTALWRGKRIADADGVIWLEVVKGEGRGVFEVDGISGATRTGGGVSRLVRFWLGPDGYGPYLKQLKRQGSS